ncbi:class I SAM-dependent methyltransferase [Anianabacter salinae]|uniref:class I SAM-dependent methyltransferase n=1 Tax=Anianabacter salinae TaxID=2851023 RepID=UPI00225E5989|nr:class I SAM-dependent methyltransferase [Anianabacter salinae]MBV0911442.1 class I SAM-dependent methyltransferase [Anianabacter salinae]
MGIDLVLFSRLADLSTRMPTPKRSLMLGRQTLVLREKGEQRYNKALRWAGVEDKEIRDLVTDDHYAEDALFELGFGHVESLDYSPSEGAQHIADLNRPVDESLHEQFDFIFDGGTIEHVFNVAQALENVFKMLRPGGIFASANGMNGWWAHGFYQFNPDLVYSFWKRSAGCEVMNCMALPTHQKFPAVDLPDPAEFGRRLRGLGQQLPQSRVYLYYEVRKSEEAVLQGPALQSDYVSRWQRDDSHPN